MAKKRRMGGSAKHIADIFIRNSLHITRQEFADLVEYALQDNTQEEVKAIAAHMPPMLRELLPRKYVH